MRTPGARHLAAQFTDADLQLILGLLRAEEASRRGGTPGGSRRMQNLRRVADRASAQRDLLRDGPTLSEVIGRP